MTKATNKHLLPVYDRPMIYYPIQTLVDAGIKDIMVVTGGDHAGDFIRVLRNGEDFDLDSLSYAYQEGSGGIADALSKAESFVGADNCAVILGDNVFQRSPTFEKAVREHQFTGGAAIFTKKVLDPERFGVVEWAYGNTPKSIIEKPMDPPSNDAVTGFYLYDNTVFQKIKTLVPSARGELEVTDLNLSYLRDYAITAHNIDLLGWIDCGTPLSLANATQRILTDWEK
jgi:glucose-1-phosphate thymidylyltransferase